MEILVFMLDGLISNIKKIKVSKTPLVKNIFQFLESIQENIYISSVYLV